MKIVKTRNKNTRKSKPPINPLLHDRQLKFFQDFLPFAIEALNPQKIILFGSRARGNPRPRSDIDLAFKLNKKTGKLTWAEFCCEVEESLFTLLSFDLVNVDEASDKLLNSIRQEGIVLYER